MLFKHPTHMHSYKKQYKICINKIYATDIRFWFLRFMKHKVQKYIKMRRKEEEKRNSIDNIWKSIHTKIVYKMFMKFYKM